MKQLVLSLVTTALALLLCEGVLSIAFGHSLRDLVPHMGASSVELPAPTPREDEPGLYRIHPDPLVGYVLRANADLAIHDGHIRSDDLGLRVRPGPPRGEGALRLVVLGDSVAFGYGVNDDQTLAHQLELLLNDAGGAGGRPIECRTVAMPGWNHRNAVHFLLDHMDALAPDVVLYLPVANDLFDTDGMDETGHRVWIPDPAAADPLLAVYQGPGFGYGQRLLESLKQAGTPEIVGSSALIADISPESDRRYEENTDSIALLADTLRARGARLLLVQFQEGIYPFHLLRHLLARGLDLPLLPLFSSVPRELTLGSDPHPNAEALAGVARWIAADLLAGGWIAGDAGRVPPESAALEGQRAPARPTAEILASSEHVRTRQRALLRPTIDIATGEGSSQAYGGVHDDGSIGGHALFLLRRGGPRLTVRLAPIAARRDLYPLAVDVAIDGRPVGRLEVTADGPAEQSFDVPAANAAADAAAGSSAEPMEVRLAPERAVVAEAAGLQQLVACSMVRLSCQ